MNNYLLGIFLQSETSRVFVWGVRNLPRCVLCILRSKYVGTICLFVSKLTVHWLETPLFRRIPHLLCRRDTGGGGEGSPAPPPPHTPPFRPPPQVRQTNLEPVQGQFGPPKDGRSRPGKFSLLTLHCMCQPP
jgi:hypothetical protein